MTTFRCLSSVLKLAVLAVVFASSVNAQDSRVLTLHENESVKIACAPGLTLSIQGDVALCGNLCTISIVEYWEDACADQGGAFECATSSNVTITGSKFGTPLLEERIGGSAGDFELKPLKAKVAKSCQIFKTVKTVYRKQEVVEDPRPAGWQ